MTLLSLPIKFYEILLSTGEKKVVGLVNTYERADLIKRKFVGEIDGVTLNFSYVVSVDEVKPRDAGFDTALAWAKSLTHSGYKAVAIARYMSYKNNPKSEGVLSIEELKKWVMNFRENPYLNESWDKFIQIFNENYDTPIVRENYPETIQENS